MVVLVTGGSGHVGANLVRQLLDRGDSVRCLVRKDTRALDGLDVEFVRGDLTDAASLSLAMAGVDTVYHAAAYVGVERREVPLMQRINVDGTQAMCTAALEADVNRFIHFSSVHAFQQRPTDEPLTESRALVESARAAPYDRTKAAAQRKVLAACEAGLNASILHPTGVIGPYDFKPSRMGKVLCDFAQKGRGRVTLNTGFNWVDVRDVCATAINCGDRGRPGQHYLLPGEWGSFPRLLNAVEEAMDRKIGQITLPFWMAYLALPFAAVKAKISGERPSFSRGSLHALALQCRDIPGTLAGVELGHAPRPLEETVSDTILWLRENGSI